ncbi:VWA domain-containing protein [Ectothiorhodospiraceae bacterium BW-2]|nr:VWA domain-containing protein [Ectothiorhodospiraceae bacterium BW-2]
MNDLIDNPSPRCACALVLDTSGSMMGAPIAELNQGLLEFIHTIKEDDTAAYSVELGIFTAGGQVQELLPFTTLNELETLAPLSARGGTPLGEAVELAIKRLDERKQAYKQNGVPYYQPWMVMMSDGEPTDTWQGAAATARMLSESRKLVSLPVGVQGANLNTLGQFSHRGAKAMAGLKYHEFFQWLSASMSRVSTSASTSSAVALPQTASWDTI